MKQKFHSMMIVIKKLCILCACTYVLNLLIGLIAIDYKNGGLVKAFKQSVSDFISSIKNRKYLVAFLVVLFLASGFLTYIDPLIGYDFWIVSLETNQVY